MLVTVNKIADLHSHAREFPQIMATGSEPKLEAKLHAVL